MSRYEETYGTDWESLGVDGAVKRAYALGVAASLDEHHPDELEAVREEMGSSCERSVVDLAYEEGKTEGQKEDMSGAEGGDEVWSALVDDGPVRVDADDVPTGGRTGLPEAVDRIDALERPTPDENEAIDRPSFLDRD